MRKIFAAVIFMTVIIAAFSGCKKIIREIFQGIDADVPQFSVTLPVIPFVPPGEAAFPISQHFNLDSTVRAQTGGVYGAGDVSSVKVKQMIFALSNADTLNNLSNFESVRITISSDTKTDTVSVASITFPDTYASTVTYTPVNSPNLKPYLNGSVLNYVVYGKLRRITTKQLNVVINVTLRVE